MKREASPDPSEKQALLLETRVADLERELVEQYYLLGKSVCELAGRKIDEINSLVDQLVEAKRRLTRERGQIPCAHCLSLNPGDSRFCGRCGKPLDG